MKNSNTSKKEKNAKASNSAKNSTKSSAKNSTKSDSSSAMKRFKEECANDVGVKLNNGYNGNLTSKEAGSIGGEMVKKMIKNQTDQMK